ncbi:MAG: hypothetical protein B6241_06305 [Spirochaetaceae bacterium 4572_59]|nr:MAG: hypothetical protein B6241_06305 [Spirochaetaceae bacterium 4572_59]
MTRRNIFLRIVTRPQYYEREDENINKQLSDSCHRYYTSLFFLLALTILFLVGCAGFTPELLTFDTERERIIEDVLVRGRIYTIRSNKEVALIDLMENPNPEIRLTALKIMESNPSPTIYDAVLRATLDDEDNITEEAFRILDENWEETKKSVLRGLNSTSASLILSSVNVIKRKEYAGYAPYLLTLFSDNRNIIRSAASRTYAGLGSYEDQWFQSLLTHENSISRLTAVETLPRFRNPDLIPAIIPFIGDENPDIRRAALFGLSEYDVDALPFLHETLRFSKDEELRFSVLQIVEGILDSSSIPVLIRLMDDQNERIALKSVEVLLRLGPDVVIPVLIENIGQMEKAALIQSFLLMKKFQDRRMLPELIPYINHQDPDIAEAAIDTLHSYGSKASSFLLLQLRSDSLIKSLSLELLVKLREPLLVYSPDTGQYRTDNIFMIFEQISQDGILNYLRDVPLPSKIVSSLWNLYDIETNTILYQESRHSIRNEYFPYFYYYKSWEKYVLAAESSRTSSYAYQQDFFETNDERWLSESKMLRETADLYERAAVKFYEKAKKAESDAAEEDLLLLQNYLESRRALIVRWRILTSDIQDMARLIFLRYSLDIETLTEEYDFFRSLPQGEVP